MFRVLSHHGSKTVFGSPSLLGDVKTASYQLLLEEEMVPNAEKDFALNFLFVHNNILAHRAGKFQ